MITTKKEILRAVGKKDAYNDRICTLVKSIVSDYYDQPITNYKSRSRMREIVKLRQVTAYFISKLLPKATLKYIGSMLSNYDHATVLHSVRTINNAINTDRSIRKDVEAIDKILRLRVDFDKEGDDIANEYYFIGMDTCHSAKLPNGQGLVFTNMIPSQIADITALLSNYYSTTLCLKPHKDTGLFILERLPKENDN